jgi:hypothetical protein
LEQQEKTMGLINPKPRFALDDITGNIYDYVAQKDIVPTDQPYAAADGNWNLNLVKAAILAGTTLEAGHLSLKTPAVVGVSADAQPLPGTPAHPLQQPTTVQAPGRPQPTTTLPNVRPGPPLGNTPPAPAGGFSAEQLTALKLSPLQAAALRLTWAQMTTTGVTKEQVAGWHMTAERADALKLTAEQRKVLVPLAVA